jgi:hypothetical protein
MAPWTGLWLVLFYGAGQGALLESHPDWFVRGFLGWLEVVATAPYFGQRELTVMPGCSGR